MAKEIVKVKAALEGVLNAIDAHKKDKGHLPEVLECNVETFSHLHTAVMLTIEDDKLKKIINDRGLKTKVDSLTKIRVNPAREAAVAF